MRWSDASKEKLRELVSQRLPYKEIALRFGISVNAVKLRASRLGLKQEDAANIARRIAKEKKRCLSAGINLAQRFVRLQGATVKVCKEEKGDLQDSELLSWLDGAEGIAKFTSSLFGVGLLSYQKEMVGLFLKHRKCVIRSGRGVGKTTIAALFALYQVLTKANCRILIISPTERQSIYLLSKVSEFIDSNPETKASVVRETADSIAFSNNSQINALCSSTFVRGFHGIDYILCDEAAYFAQPDAIMSAVLPMVSIKSPTGEVGTLILLSTPGGTQGWFWDAWNSPVYSGKLHVPATENPYLDKNWLREAEETMPRNYYDQEVLGEFCEAQDSFFSTELIKKVSRPYDLSEFPEEGVKYYAGMDIGRIKDASAIVIIGVQDGIATVKNIKTLNNVPFVNQQNFIAELHSKYRFQRIVVERAGLSLPVVEALQDLGLPVQPFVPTTTEKIEGYNYLLKCMEKNEVVVPSTHSALQFQLRAFKYTINFRGQLLLHHATESAGDDLCDALMMAVLGSKTPMNTACFIEHAPAFIPHEWASSGAVEKTEHGYRFIRKPARYGRGGFG